MQEKRLLILSLAKKIEGKIERLSDYKRLVCAIVAGDLPRVGALFRASVRRGNGVAATITLVQKAQDGVYKVCGFTKKDTDFNHLAYAIGGRRLQYAFSQANGAASLRTLKRTSAIPPILPMYDDMDFKILRHNIRILKYNMGNTESQSQYSSILTDGVYVDRKSDYNNHTNSIVGLVSREVLEGGDPISRMFETADQVEKIKELIDSGELQHATEALVYGIKGNHWDDRHAQVLAILPYVSSLYTPERRQRQIMFIVYEWNQPADSDAPSSGLPPVWLVVGDGDASLRKGVRGMMTLSVKDVDEELFAVLGSMPLLDLVVGPQGLLFEIDWRHEFKRARGPFIALGGGVKLGDHCVSRSIVERLFRMRGIDEGHIASMLLIDDAQNVPAAVELLMSLRDLSGLDEIDFPDQDKGET
jgi:hypothetical protein